MIFTGKFTKAGLLTAIGVVLFFMASFMHIGVITLGVLQICLMMAAVMIFGISLAFKVYLAISILGMLFIPSLSVFMFILFSGSFPLVKAYINLHYSNSYKLNGPLFKIVYFISVWCILFYVTRFHYYSYLTYIRYSNVGLVVFLIMAFVADKIIDKYSDKIYVWLGKNGFLS